MLAELEEQNARLRQQREEATRPPREEPLQQVVRKLKWIRQDLDGLIAHFDALLAAWPACRSSPAGWPNWKEA